MKYYSKTGSILLILISLFLQSCSSVPLSLTASPEIPVVVTTVQATAVPASQTPAPPSPTVTSTPTPVWTPLPTLSTIEAAERVWHLYETKGGCEYPCWWGITPGETKARSAIEYLKSFAFQVGVRKNSPDNLTRYEIYFPVDEKPSLGNATKVFIYVDPANDSIKLIRFGQSMDLQSFFEKSGVPEQIYLKVGAMAGYSRGDYGIFLYYPDKGILGGMGGITDIVVKNREQYMLVCAKDVAEDDGVNRYAVWSPLQPFSIKDLVEIYHPNEIYPDQPLQETSNMSIEDFYNMALGISETDTCLEIEMSHWGYTP